MILSKILWYEVDDGEKWIIQVMYIDGVFRVLLDAS